jgi:hypothetical protein
VTISRHRDPASENAPNAGGNGADFLLSSALSASQRNAARAREVPRLALRVEEAAASIGVSRAYFDEHVLPSLRVVTLGGLGRGRGHLRLIPIRSLEAWLDKRAALPLEEAPR